MTWLIIIMAIAGAIWLARRWAASNDDDAHRQQSRGASAGDSRTWVSGASGSAPSRSSPRPPLGPPEAPPGPNKAHAVSGLVFGITYQNRDDERSRRVIEVKDVYDSVRSDSGQALYVDAYCFSAEAERTFRADRILRMIDHRSGEEIADPKAYFARFVDPPPEVKRSHQAVMNRARPGLRALIWIARADRELAPAEVDLLLDYIDARNAYGREPGEWDRDLARLWILRDRPTLNEAAGGISRIGGSGGQVALFETFSEAMVDLAGEDRRLEDQRRDRLMKLLR
ncbi:WYL domain-containing protein [Afifella sp. YEN Y35]|uniref:WYL domain-containing protein n=1 Tax=Afifella sp. YEN Y35 TaxID=3388337 RepID=UPI0039E12886